MIGGLEKRGEKPAPAEGVEERQQTGAVGRGLEVVILVQRDGVNPRRDMIVALPALHGCPVALCHAVHIPHRHRALIGKLDHSGYILADLVDVEGITLLETAPAA